jgi:3-phosphoshikimate 1-carboxyvinyltransferase
VVCAAAEELRVKESDRIAVLVAGFRNLGIGAEERADGYAFAGRHRAALQWPTPRRSRMAMAFRQSPRWPPRPVSHRGADAVGISYPGFFDTLEQLVQAAA